jgi:2Fe-2S ferredoxin
MAKVTYVLADQTARTVELKPGTSVMEGAVRNNIPGIDAECGGACSCATCHVYVASEWFARTGGPASIEQSMLDFTSCAKPTSRLSCQIKVTDELDGLVVQLPGGDS